MFYFLDIILKIHSLCYALFLGHIYSTQCKIVLLINLIFQYFAQKAAVVSSLTLHGKKFGYGHINDDQKF